MDGIAPGLGSAPAVTPQPTITTPLAPESDNGVNPNLIQENDAVKDWKSEYEKTAQRYSDSSREATKLREEKDSVAREAESARQELVGFVTKDRSRFEEYVDSKSLSPKEKEYYMNIYDTQIAPTKGSSVSNNAIAGVTDKLEKPNSPSVTPREVEDPFRESWMNRMDEQEKSKWNDQRNASIEFFAREENKQLPAPVLESIRATAAMLDEVYNYTPKEALEMARKRILNPDDIRDEGYAQAVRDSYTTRGISAGVIGGTSTAKNSIKLPSKDEAFVQLEIQRRGLKGDDAEKYRAAYAARVSK